MEILVVGAAGLTGRQVVKQAVAAGHRVTALARTVSHLADEVGAVTLIRADAGDGQTMRAALEGQDAVICVMGNRRPRKRDPELVKAVSEIVKLMEEGGPKRLVYLSTILVPESRARAGKIAATIAPLIIGNEIADHVEKERVITSSALDWTIVRATKLSNAEATGRYLAGEDVVASKALGMVSRADLASFLLTDALSKTFLHKTPCVVM